MELNISELKSSATEKENEIQDLKKRLDLLAQNGALKQNELRKEIELLRDQIENNDSIEQLRRQSESSSTSLFDSSKEHSAVNVSQVSEMKDAAVTLNETFTKLPEYVDEPASEDKPKGIEDDQLNANRLSTYEKRCKELECELETAKSAELSARTMIEDLQTSLKNYGEEKQNLQKKLASLRSERHVMQKQLKHYEQLEREDQKFESLLLAKTKESDQSVSSAELAAIKNDIMNTLKINLDAIHMQLSKNLNSADGESKQVTVDGEKLSELSRLENELVQTRAELQSLQREIQKMPKYNVETVQQKDSATDDKNNLKNDNQYEILEAKAVIYQSKIDRLQDEIELHEENSEKLKGLLQLEKQLVQSLKEEHQLEIENLHKQYKQEMELLRSVFQSKCAQLTSDSSSPSDGSQQIVVQNGRSKKLKHSSDSAPDSEHEQPIIPVPGQVHALLEKVHKEGVEMLSLSELLFLRSHSSGSQQHQHPNSGSLSTLQQAWDNEKHQLLSEIMALKELLSQATEATASLRSTGEATTELSNLLLKTVATVFQRERATTLAELRTHVLSNNPETPDDFKRLERKLNEMDGNQKGVLEKVQHLLENHRTSTDYDSVLTKERLQHHQERESLLNQITKLEELAHNQEKHLKRKMDLLDFRIQQEQKFTEELRSCLELEKKRTLDLTSHLSREKGINADLEMSLTLTRTELIKTQAALDKDKREIQNLKIVSESERYRSVALNQALEIEQANFNQLQEAMEAEKRRSKASSERQQQIIQELQQSLEKSKKNHIEAVTSLDRERINLVNAYQELENLKNKINADPSLSSRALKSKKTDLSQVHNDLNRIQDLTVALERERRRVMTVTGTLAQERTAAAEEIDSERTTNLNLKKDCEAFKEQNLNLNKSLQEQTERIMHLESERNQLQKQLGTLREQDVKKTVDREAERQLEHEHHREMQLLLEQERQKLQEQKLENQKVLQKILVLEKQVQQLRESESQLYADLKHEREQNSALIAKKSWMNLPITKPLVYDNHTVEAAKQQLQCFLLKCRMELENMCNQKGAGDSNYNMFHQFVRLSLQDIDEVKLEHLPLSETDEEVHLSQFAEQVLHQNAELIGFVSKLCEDKMELRKLQTKLEDELVDLRHKEMISEQSLKRSLCATKETLATERASWAEEKAALQLSLHKAEAKLAQLPSESRSQSLHPNQEASTSNNLTSRTDSKWKHWHLKYLRVESYRKALVYQKKYLLIVLGGFQDTEATTLAMIAQMGIPEVATSTDEMRKRSPVLRFRSYVRVVTAICRMKFLVRRWKRPSPLPSPLGSSQDLYSHSQGSRPPSTSLDFPYKKIHRIGTTPPVKDCHSPVPSERSSSSSVRRNLAFFPSSNAPLQRYIERMDLLQQQIGIKTPTASNVNTNHKQ